MALRTIFKFKLAKNVSKFYINWSQINVKYWCVKIISKTMDDYLLAIYLFLNYQNICASYESYASWKQ